jgi:hypothetical protein
MRELSTRKKSFKKLNIMEFIDINSNLIRMLLLSNK